MINSDFKIQNGYNKFIYLFIIIIIVIMINIIILSSIIRASSFSILSS